MGKKESNWPEILLVVFGLGFFIMVPVIQTYVNIFRPKEIQPNFRWVSKNYGNGYLNEWGEIEYRYTSSNDDWETSNVNFLKANYAASDWCQLNGPPNNKAFWEVKKYQKNGWVLFRFYCGDK